jgi:flagellar biosynthetic protein FliR
MGHISFQSWPAAHPLIALAVLVRMVAAVSAGGLGMFPDVDMRVKAAMALALAASALPMAATAASVDDLSLFSPSILPFVAGEAAVGFGLGLVVALVFSAASWAGGILASVAGLSWSDDFTPETDAGEGGGARLAGWLAVGGFLAAGGHLAIVAGLIDSVARVPVGGLSADKAGGLFEAVATMPAVALELAWTLAVPALAAVLTFHVAVAICLRSVRFTAGQGLVQAAASLVLLAAILQGAATWTEGFATAAQGSLERGLADLRR